MKIEEAIKWMEEAIQDTKEFFDQCSPALQEELTKQKEVFELAIAALRSMPETGEPLTLEQLRGMDGKPVWVDYIGDITCPSQWCVVNTFLDKVGNTDFEFPFECDPDEGYGKTWLAYAYPPVHIDRGEWGGCDCDKPKSCCTCCSMRCQYCIGQSEYRQALYCMKCGKPQTEKAWAELERRFQKVTHWMPLPEPLEVKDHG